MRLGGRACPVGTMRPLDTDLGHLGSPRFSATLVSEQTLCDPEVNIDDGSSP